MNKTTLLSTSATALAGATAFWATGIQATEIDTFTYDLGGGQSFTIDGGSSDYAHQQFTGVTLPVTYSFNDVFSLSEPGSSSCTTSYDSVNYSLGTCSDAYLLVAGYNSNDLSNSTLDLYLVSDAASQADLNAFYQAGANAYGGFGTAFVSDLNYYVTEETGSPQDIGFRIWGIGTVTVQSTEVPAPPSLALLAAGAAGLGVARRRRRARPA